MTNTTVLIGICCYFACIIFIGFLLRHKNKGAEDFLVGGRSFGLLFNSGTLIAVFLGGAMVIGTPGTVTTFGIWDSEARWGFLVGIGAGLCLLLAGMFYMRKLWELKLLSLGDYFYKRFGNSAGLTATILLCFTFTVYIAVQIVSFAKVGVSLAGMSLTAWIMISMAVICTYTVLGGLWAVCLTDIIQVSIVTLSIIILTPVTISMVGGWDAFVANFPTEKLEVFPTENTVDDWMAWSAALLMVGLGSICSPDLMQRAFSAKTARVAKHSAYVATIVFVAMNTLVVILAFATVQLMDQGDMDSSFMEHDPEMLIPMAFQQLMPTPIVIIFLGAVLAAVMSCAATSNIALAGVISKNLIKDFFVKDMSDRGLMNLTRVVVVAIGAVGAYIAIALPSAFMLAALGFDLIFSCLFIPLTLGLYWKGANGYGAIAGMIGGAAFRIVGSGLVNGFSLEGIGTPHESWQIFTLGGPMVSLAAMVLVSFATQKLNKPIEVLAEQEEKAA